MKTLVIVESPTKARTLRRFLGSDYEIKASIGHVMDLPKSTIGVDIEHNFAPDYQIVEGKKKVISELKTAGKRADAIILATDPDREGEAIASHIKDMLGLNENLKMKNAVPAGKAGKFKRIAFHEITKEAIDDALKNPRDINEALVDAQTARRVLDRLVGYKISPVLWQKIRRGLSAGRVQSVALRLIVEREREIEKFKKEKYWTISAFLTQRGPVAGLPPAHLRQPALRRGLRQGEDFGGQASASAALSLEAKRSGVGSPSSRATHSHGTEFELIEINNKKIEIQETLDLYDGKFRVTKTTIDRLEKAKEIVEDLTKKKFIVSDVLQKEARRNPYPPFTTSTLQQEAARKLGFSGKRTMTVAQKLYEEGFITYHRTDSVAMAKVAMFSIRKYIEKEFGKKYVPENPKFYKTRQKLAQEAHEAIRPTGLNNQPSTINNQLGRDFTRLYDLIFRRAVSSQMADAIIQSTTVVVDSQNSKLPGLDKRSGAGKTQNSKMENNYRLKVNGSVLLFDGFLKVSPQALSDTILPEFKVSQELEADDVSEKEHETQPPPRYNDASLVATLEEKGIGRPSTYATIISTIESRQYIERLEVRFVPTPVGITVNDFLVKNFSTIDDIPFTASMEDELDAIANEKKEWVPVIRNFYTPFEKTLEEVKTADRVKIEVEETDEKCPKCGANLVIRIGKFGKFLACSAFPKCNFTKPYAEETGFVCPRCGSLPANASPQGDGRRGKIILKKSKKGRYFYGCSNYPTCTFAAWKLEDIKKQGLSS